MIIINDQEFLNAMKKYKIDDGRLRQFENFVKADIEDLLDENARVYSLHMDYMDKTSAEYKRRQQTDTARRLGKELVTKHGKDIWEDSITSYCGEAGLDFDYLPDVEDAVEKYGGKVIRN